MEAWYAEVAEIAARANAWCNFAIVCGWIGFGLSVICAVILFVRWKMCSQPLISEENLNFMQSDAYR